MPGCEVIMRPSLGVICGDQYAGGNEWGCARFFCPTHRLQDAHQCTGPPEPTLLIHPFDPTHRWQNTIEGEHQ